MNNKTGLILRLILGGYLVFLGISVIIQAVQTNPGDVVIKVLFGVLFILVGGAYAISQMRKVYHLVKKETEETDERDAKNSTQPLFEKPQHDESLYRTAPMPTETIAKKMPAQSTDLRANMKQMQEEEKETATQTEQEKVKEQVKQNESNGDVQNKEQAAQKEEPAEQAELKKGKKPQSSQLGIQIEEKSAAHTEMKDPVNLAIEIMRNEDKELAEKAEELENDYEEK